MIFMNQSQYFEFEDKNSDFPYYKNKNFFSNRSGLLLLFSIILFILLIFGPIKFKTYQEELILFLAMSLPFVIALKGRLGSLFKKPKISDIKLVILCVLGNLFLLLIITTVDVIINTVLPINIIHATSSFGSYDSITLLNCIVAAFQIVAEEIFRIMIFITCLYVAYKFSNNRKTSIIIAVVFSLLVFGLMHANTYSNILYCIVVMGFGTFFTLYPYLKTKNVLLSIFVHMIWNLLVLIVQTTVG